MKALLICPSDRPAVALLAKDAPLAKVPLLGQSLLEYWLAHLACSDVESVTILAHDRPEEVTTLVGDGARWGLSAAVTTESRELSPDQALMKYASHLDKNPTTDAIATLDHFPGLLERPLFTTYAGWFAALQEWMPRALTPDRVGVHEIRPGVWAGVHAHISPQATVQAPCWLGTHVYIGPGAVLGPHTIVEDRAFIEPETTITESYVGPDTFVGRFAQIVNSVAWGDTLLNWQTGSALNVRDSFLLCALRQPPKMSSAGWRARLTDLFAHNKEEVDFAMETTLIHKEG